MRHAALLASLAIAGAAGASARTAETPAEAVARHIPRGIDGGFANVGFSLLSKWRVEAVEVADRCRVVLTTRTPRLDGKELSRLSIWLGDVTRVQARDGVVGIAQDGRLYDIANGAHPLLLEITDADTRRALVAALAAGEKACDPRVTGGAPERRLARSLAGASLELPSGSRSARRRDAGPYFGMQINGSQPCDLALWRGDIATMVSGKALVLQLDFAKPVAIVRRGQRFDFTGPGIWYRRGVAVTFVSARDADIADAAFAELKGVCARR